MHNRIFFETERLIVMHLSRSYFGAIREIQRDERTMEFFGSKASVPLTDERIASNFNIIMAHFDQFKFSYGPVFEKSTGILIGNAGLNHLDFNPEDPVIEIGYFILPEFWGQGFASELAPCLIEIAFKEFKAPKVVATVDASNIPSCKICEKMGMRFEGQFPYETLQGKMLNNYGVYPDWTKPTKQKPLISHNRESLLAPANPTVFKYMGSLQDEIFAVPEISLSSASDPKLIRVAIDTHNITLIHTDSDYLNSQRRLQETINDFPREYLILTASSRVFDHVEFEATCERLGTDYLDIYYLDGLTLESVSEVMKTMLDLKKANKIRGISLSYVSSAVVKAAHAIYPLTSVLIDYSLWNCNFNTAEILETCRTLGIRCISATTLPAERSHLCALETLAKSENCTPEQLAQAWVLHQGCMIQSNAKNLAEFSQDIASGILKPNGETLRALNDFSRNIKNL